jgi:predicted amidohydrolase YtcJ
MKYFNYINKFDKATEVTLKWIILLTVVTAVSGCDKSNELAVHQESKVANTIADLIIHNAQIITVDENFSIAEAVAIRDGKFIAVGSNDEILTTASKNTRIVDLQGMTMLPGFNDTHSHLVQMGLNLPATIDISAVESIADIQKVIAARVQQSDAGAWIFSEGGWWEFMLSEGRLPNRHDLDLVSPGNPVVLRGGHYFIVNSLALERIGYDKNTEDPPGGEIWRDAEGELTGFLLRAAHGPTHQYFPALERDQQLEGISQAIKRVNSWGMTSLREAGGSKDHVEMLRELYDQGKLTVRVDWAYDVDPNTPPDEIDSVFQSLGPPGEHWGDGMFRADGLAELFLDGAEESGQLRGNYFNRPDYHGLRLVQQDQLNLFIAASARHGWRPGPHAVGDASIDQALEAFEYANAQVSIVERRWMIDHAILLQPDHYERVKQLGLVINAQPRHLYIIGDKFIEFWGRPVAEGSYRLRDWLDNGLIVALGADRPVSPRSTPLMQITIAVTRKTGWDGVLGVGQEISREEAIRATTATGAYTSFEENVKGTVELGKYADFVVLAEDILTVPAESIKDIEIVATVLAGETVYGLLP